MKFLKYLVSSLQAGVLIKPTLKILRNRTSTPSFWTMPHDPICREIIVNGFYERELLVKMCALVKDKDSVVLDVGANIGNHTVFFSQIFRKVMAFEPSESNCWILKANLYLNKINNVILVEKALGDVAGFAKLDNENPYDTNNGFHDFSLQPSKTGSASIEVLLGDAAVKEYDLACPISLIKVDVEGHEANVVRGLSATIRQHSPLVCWEAFTLDKVNETKKELEALGYKYFYHVTTKKSDSKLMNRVKKLFDRGAILKDLSVCRTFEGMNVASMQALSV